MPKPRCLLLSLALLTGCAAAPEPAVVVTAGKTSYSESQKADAFFESAFMERVMRNPERQSYLGIRKDYDKWDDDSEARAQEDLAVVRRQLDTLRRSIDYDRLDEQTRLSYDLFVFDAQRYLDSFPFRHHNYPVSQNYGVQSQVPAFLINIHRIDTVSDARAYIARLNGVPKKFAQTIDGLKMRADKGIVPPRFVFPHVLESSRNVLSGAPFDDSGRDSALLADFRAKTAALDLGQERQEDLLRQAGDALLGSVRPAYEALIGYVTELEEKATTDDGAWKLPNGEAFYAQALRNYTTTQASADEIHAIGVAEVARIQDEMRVIMAAVGFEGTLQDIFLFLRNEPRFYYEDTDEGRQAYLAGATAIIRTMKTNLDRLFLTVPKTDVVVKAVEPFRESTAGKAFYQRPAPDGSRPGTYYVNLYRMSDMPTYQMEALAYHEGLPGHHMQLAIAQEMDGIPKFRRHGRFTAHTEGWGLYTEMLPKEIGFYEDPYSDFGRLAMELWRACRLVVDTGIHANRWTREQAIEYLMDNTPNPRGDAVKAIERYIVRPGQATAYKIGMLKILELRQHARDELRERFDIRAFHDVILRNGPVPLSTLEALVDDYIAAARG